MPLALLFLLSDKYENVDIDNFIGNQLSQSPRNH